MTTVHSVARTPATQQPRLLFFTSPVSGHCRKVQGYLAQVLQRRRNHDTFRVHMVDPAERPDLAERFRVTATPTLLVVSDRHERGRVEKPRGCKEIERLLAPWLR